MLNDEDERDSEEGGREGEEGPEAFSFRATSFIGSENPSLESFSQSKYIAIQPKIVLEVSERRFLTRSLVLTYTILFICLVYDLVFAKYALYVQCENRYTC